LFAATDKVIENIIADNFDSLLRANCRRCDGKAGALWGKVPAEKQKPDNAHAALSGLLLLETRMDKGLLAIQALNRLGNAS
jgi:hypothetical protein